MKVKQLENRKFSNISVQEPCYKQNTTQTKKNVVTVLENFGCSTPKKHKNEGTKRMFGPYVGLVINIVCVVSGIGSMEIYHMCGELC